MTVYTEAVAFKADTKLLTFIEEKLAKLETMFDRIIDARVTLKLESRGKVKDKVAEVRIHLPGQTLIAKHANKSFEASIMEIIDSLKRQIKRYKSRLQEKR